MLARARTQRGLSLWQVEEATKIRARYLRDLERENFDVLPAVYVLGSLKTYADFLGLDGEALALELKNRQAPTQGEDPPPDEARQPERAGLLASLGALLGFGGSPEIEDERGATGQAAGRGPRLYWGLGGVLLLALLVSLASTLGGGGAAVPEIREPALSEAPDRMALSSEVEKDEERATEQQTEDRHEGKAGSPDGGGKEDDEKDATDRADKKGEKGQDAGGTGQQADDVALTPTESFPASTSAASASTASASTASAGASAAASASATPTAPAPVSAAPRRANPGAAPAAGARPAPTTAGRTGNRPVPTAGTPRAETPQAARPAQRIAGDVRVVKRVVRYVR